MCDQGDDGCCCKSAVQWGLLLCGKIWMRTIYYDFLVQRRQNREQSGFIEDYSLSAGYLSNWGYRQKRDELI